MIRNSHTHPEGVFFFFQKSVYRQMSVWMMPDSHSSYDAVAWLWLHWNSNLSRLRNVHCTDAFPSKPQLLTSAGVSQSQRPSWLEFEAPAPNSIDKMAVGAFYADISDCDGGGRAMTVSSSLGFVRINCCSDVLSVHLINHFSCCGVSLPH